MAKCPKCGLDYKVNVRKCPNCRTVMSPIKKDIDLPKLKNDVKLGEEKSVKEVKVKQIPLKVKRVKSFKNEDRRSSSLVREKKFSFMSSLKIVFVSLLLLLNVLLIINIVIQVDGAAPSTLEKNYEDSIKKIDTEISLNGSWITQNSGKFLFQDDNKFYWYDNYQVLDDNYYGGSFTYKQGEEALSDMGITYYELCSELEVEDIKIDNIYSIELVPILAIRNRQDATISNLKKDEKWWMLFIITEDRYAVAYNKTLDLRYSLKKD